MQSGKICKYFLENRCREGDKCRFSHQIPRENNLQHHKSDNNNFHATRGPSRFNAPSFRDQNGFQNNRRFNRRDPRSNDFNTNFETHSRASYNESFRQKKQNPNVFVERDNSTEQQQNPLILHRGNQEYLKELNFNREKYNLGKLIIQTALTYKDQIILTFAEKSFILVYDLKTHDFVEKDQLYINVRINESIQNLCISNFNHFNEDFILVSYNRQNDIQIKMAACLGLEPVNYLGSGQYFREIIISTENPVHLSLLSKNFIFCTFYDINFQQSRVILYKINKLDNSTTMNNLVEKLAEIKTEHTLKERLTAVNSHESIFIFGTDKGTIGIINCENEEVKSYNPLNGEEITFIDILQIDPNSPTELIFIFVSKKGQILITNFYNFNSSHSFSQNVTLTKCVKYKEGLVNKVML